MSSPLHKKGTHAQPGRPARHTLVINPALEHLARRLSVGTASLEVTGRTPQVAGQIREADFVLALDHACQQVAPIAWDLFWAKYMDNTASRAQLGWWVVQQLRGSALDLGSAMRLSDLVVRQVCDGVVITGRGVGRALGVDRKHTWQKLRPEVDAVLYRLFQVEDEVAANFRKKSR
jgi:hypothetical protein